jgi:hypothetical protein
VESSVESSVERSASPSAASSSGSSHSVKESDELVALWHLRMRELVGYTGGKLRQTAPATDSCKEAVQKPAAYLMPPSEWSVLPTVEYTPQPRSQDDSSASDQVGAH